MPGQRDPVLVSILVILLSARAGEEARIEGMNAGADDYLTKPFAARELVARVNANLTLANGTSRVADGYHRVSWAYQISPWAYAPGKLAVERS